MVSDDKGQTQSQRVAEQIRDMIMTGQIEPGARLYEQLLTSLTGASRTPVRAALSELANEGMVTYTPNRGYEVRRFTLDDIINAYRVRAVLEGLACRTAAEIGLRPIEEEALIEAGEAVDSILKPGQLNDDDRETWQRWNILFHQTIIVASRNTNLPKVLAVVTNIPMVSNSMVSWFDFENVRRFHEHHRRVLEMIRKRNPGRAEALMREHIEQASDFIYDIFNGGPATAGQEPLILAGSASSS